MRLLLAAPAALVAAALLVVPGAERPESGPSPVKRTSLGLPSPGISYPIWQFRDLARDMAEIKAAGGRHVRLDLLYNHPTAGETERAVDAARAAGLEPTLILDGSRMYGDPARPTVAHLEAWAAEVAANYAGRVDTFEVYNEPDLHGFTPATYTPILQAAARGVRRAQPGAVLVAGGISKNGCDVVPAGGCPEGKGMANWVRGLYAAGARDSFDAVALHLYLDPLQRANWNAWDQAFVYADNVRAVMDAAGDRNKPVWVNESGGPVSSEETEARQAEIVSNAVLSARTFPVAAVSIYTLHDTDVAGFGLLRSDDTRRPSFSSYREAARLTAVRE